MNVSEEESKLTGWEAIEKAFTEIYPEQDNPKHYRTIIPYILGGNDPS